ncbi:4-(cytidine 5'-diphospho)-2-C-methyl-D-erythritol kinase [Lacihabitans sp. LS3-19]|uniref:4-(cytidine 5'-diphospho)-2-C-methyl-D-erythritol kinase n=1 Tax=Lacihabitans sp. LS3-19 TaxID=2487335 RepID=UPI0020CF4D94|nr:4-(cytidine 5'-diphospho)-2-C-methyl-D-erythritol kinase [Lacihabitans sp. LS3-19]MCP9770707.1 4-(cytidine 5'-diphospho)-2-C-methyl-D-erythritol kinase [Lacihabitans sp. LS3-19]
MLSFPNAKINLGLNITEKRADGYHNIESVFYPIAWCDALEMIPSENFSFASSGLGIPGNQANNLIVKAFELLKNERNVSFEGNVAIHLHKVLPMGAGIGGGSADGAFALKMLNELFNLKLSVSQMQEFASRLGSDCPFFIENTPKFCFGKGTEFENVELDLKGKYLVLVNPQIHISTAEAYSGIKPQKPELSTKEIIKRPIYEWKEVLKNDFEEKIIQNHPKIGQIKDKLYQLGAQYASMTGSGSTVFGIFEKEIFDLESIFKRCIIWKGEAGF